MVVVVAVGFVPKAPKPVDVPKVGAVLVVPNPPKREGAEVVVVVPNPLKPPKPKEDVVVVPNVPNPVVEAGVLPKVEVVPNAVPDEAGVPNTGVVPKLVAEAAKVGAEAKPPVAVLPKPVAAGVPKVVPLPNPPVAGVVEEPKRLGAEVAGVLNPKDGVPNPAEVFGFKCKIFNNDTAYNYISNIYRNETFEIHKYAGYEQYIYIMKLYNFLTEKLTFVFTDLKLLQVEKLVYDRNVLHKIAIIICAVFVRKV